LVRLLHNFEFFEETYSCALHSILLSLFIEISFDFPANLIPFTQGITSHFQQEEEEIL